MAGREVEVWRPLKIFCLSLPSSSVTIGVPRRLVVFVVVLSVVLSGSCAHSGYFRTVSRHDMFFFSSLLLFLNWVRRTLGLVSVCAILAYCCLPLRQSGADNHHGHWTRRGVLPSSAFLPPAFPFVLVYFFSPLRTARSGRNPLPGRRSRSRHHSLRRFQLQLRCVVNFCISARRTCFPAAYRARTGIPRPG